MKKIQKKWLSNIILGYLLLNPIFDVLTSFSIHFLSKSMPIVLIIKVLFILNKKYEINFVLPKRKMKFHVFDK